MCLSCFGRQWWYVKFKCVGRCYFSSSGRIIIIGSFYFLMLITGVHGKTKFDVDPESPTSSVIGILVLFFALTVSFGGLFTTLWDWDHYLSLDKDGLFYSLSGVFVVASTFAEVQLFVITVSLSSSCLLYWILLINYWVCKYLQVYFLNLSIKYLHYSPLTIRSGFTIPS